MTAHSVVDRDDHTITCLCGAIIPAAPTRYHQSRAFWRHVEEQS